MGIGSVGAAGQVAVSNEGQKGATFRRAVPGASGAEMYSLIKGKLTGLTKDGGAKLTLDDANKSGVAEAFGARIRMTAEDGALTVVVEKYPPFVAGKLNERIRAILEKAPEEIASARAEQAAKGGWAPK